MRSEAKFSDCRRYRYWLLRVWDEDKPIVAFVGLNPSTADETKNDPTVRRCINFAKAWGYGGLLMLNVYSYRATDPQDLWQLHRDGGDIVGGPAGFVMSLQEYVHKFGAKQIIAAWGAKCLDRHRLLASGEWRLDCLKKNADGSPAHPLYLKGDLKPQPWNYAAGEA